MFCESITISAAPFCIYYFIKLFRTLYKISFIQTPGEKEPYNIEKDDGLFDQNENILKDLYKELIRCLFLAIFFLVISAFAFALCLLTRLKIQ